MEPPRLLPAQRRGPEVPMQGGTRYRHTRECHLTLEGLERARTILRLAAPLRHSLPRFQGRGLDERDTTTTTIERDECRALHRRHARPPHHLHDIRTPS